MYNIKEQDLYKIIYIFGIKLLNDKQDNIKIRGEKIVHQLCSNL